MSSSPLKTERMILDTLDYLILGVLSVMTMGRGWREQRKKKVRLGQYKKKRKKQEKRRN